MSEEDEMIKDFLLESREGLDRLDNDLLTLEKNPRDQQRLDSIFRTLHTIKGNSGFLPFKKLGTLAHAGETLLGRLRTGELSLSPEIANALLSLVDRSRVLLHTIETTGGEGDQGFEDLVSRLTSLTDAGNVKAAKESAAEKTEPGPGDGQTPEPLLPDLHGQRVEAPSEDFDFETREYRKGDAARPAKENFRPSSAIQAAAPAPAVTAPAKPKIDFHDPEPVKAPALPTPTPVERPDQGSSLLPERSSHDDTAAKGTAAQSATNIRVDVELLDKLMNLVGELVLTRNQFTQLATTLPRAQAGPWERVLLSVAQRLNLVTSDLQEGVLKTRMQRIGGLWQRLPRLVRDLAKQCGKDVVLELRGTETEMDKSLIESINDPLTHLVRNAIDHGIEGPDARRAKGKPTQGRLFLRAFHAGGQVNIEISDDGAGIDPERIRKKLVERGLMGAPQAAGLNEWALHNSIFLPGFSTAEKVTQVSGRGVGMDVVRTNIERIGGTVVIQSQVDKGTTIRIRVPLTLAITPALIVASRGQSYAIPQVNLVELFSLEPHEVKHGVERIRGFEVYRLRGKLLPLVRLDELLGLQEKDEGGRMKDESNRLHPSSLSQEKPFFNIVVIRVNDFRFGVVVDDIKNSEEIVVKPLGNTLRGLTLYAGATIMGDGKVALILDALGLARTAGILAQENAGVLHQESAPSAVRAPGQNFLICAVGTGYRLAIPLKQVKCLEEILASTVERLVGQEVVQYRGRLLPLIRLRPLLLDGPFAEPELLQVVIYHDAQERAVGVVVDDILDIAEEPEMVHGPQPVSLGAGQGARRRRDLFSGSAIINGRATDLVDLQKLVNATHPVQFEREPSDQESGIWSQGSETFIHDPDS